MDTNTNAKEQQIFASVSIQKRGVELVVCPLEWKKGSSFSVLSKYLYIWVNTSKVLIVSKTSVSKF